MNLTPEEVLESPVTEDAIVVFVTGVMLSVDRIMPVKDAEGNYVVFDSDTGDIRLSAITDDGLVVYFDSSDVLYIGLGVTDSDDLLAEFETYEEPEEETIASDIAVKNFSGIDDFLADLLGLANNREDIFAGKPFVYNEKSFLDDRARADIEGTVWVPPRF